jgi:hypothetical protein
MRYDFAYIEAVRAKAHRERSEAVYRLLIAPLLRLFTVRTHAPRAHLARQG